MLEDIDLDVAPGEAVGLIGLNGAGKTTLIKTILGLRDPQAGTIHIAGQDRLAASARHDLAYLPERFDPPWFLNALDFISFSAALYGRKVEQEEVEKQAQAIGLDPGVLKNRVQTFSKGMRQKLGLLATTQSGCGVMILDEPMSGLDPRARAQVKAMILDQKKLGKTIFLSSHILSDMDEICDRVAVLYESRIRFVGTPAAFRAQTGCESLEKAFLSLIEKPQAA